MLQHPELRHYVENTRAIYNTIRQRYIEYMYTQKNLIKMSIII